MALALIPYLEQPRLDLGFSQVYAWGLMVAVGFLLGALYSARGTARVGLDVRVAYDYALAVFVGGFAVAHLVHVFFYEPEMLDGNPWAILYIWEGVSSFGGFLGAAITSWLFFKLRRQRFLFYADPLALGFSLAWAIARIGCFLAHDHIGTPSTFFLAVDFPPPEGPRHDLGLYDSLLTWVILAVLMVVNRRRPPAGTLAGLLCVLYAIPRFFLEELRAYDARYLGITPAQYGAVALLITGVLILRVSRSQPRPPYPNGGGYPAA